MNMFPSIITTGESCIMNWYSQKAGCALQPVWKVHESGSQAGHKFSPKVFQVCAVCCAVTANPSIAVLRWGLPGNLVLVVEWTTVLPCPQAATIQWWKPSLCLGDVTTHGVSSCERPYTCNSTTEPPQLCWYWQASTLSTQQLYSFSRWRRPDMQTPPVSDTCSHDTYSDGSALAANPSPDQLQDTCIGA